VDVRQGMRAAKKAVGRYYWDLSSKNAFIKSCPAGAKLLDVGCGNNSPQFTKTLRPDIYYVGIDVSDYNQRDDPTAFADEYIVVTRRVFNDTIACMPSSFDAVVSAHNVEHCDDPWGNLLAMLRAVVPGGRIFLSFPCQASVHFPHRQGTLNFYDDQTHQCVPEYRQILEIIASQNFNINVAIKRYRPIVHLIKGLLAEPKSWLRARVMPGTWALYGFESIIWATRTV
jgi:SAM-dependent methyltransferase